MSAHSKIEWTDATWNPITGCTLVSEGCRYCYAALLAATRLQFHWSRKGLATRTAAGVARFTGEVRFNEEWLDQPLRWRKPRMIFVCAHGDLFHERVPYEWIDRIFAVMALAPQHKFQVLTKRPERLRRYVSEVADESHDATVKRFAPHMALPWPQGWPGFEWPLPNVWLGTSCEDQATADQRIPHLLVTPAAVRFVSCEPLLSGLDLSEWLHDGRRKSLSGADRSRPVQGGAGRNDLAAGGAVRYHAVDRLCDRDSKELGSPRLDWVIVGGESGRNARPMHPEWAGSIRDQCVAAGVPFFFKQWGEWSPNGGPNDGPPDYLANDGMLKIDDPDLHVVPMVRLGKKRAGRLLDGRTWNELPARRPPRPLICSWRTSDASAHRQARQPVLRGR